MNFAWVLKRPGTKVAGLSAQSLKKFWQSQDKPIQKPGKQNEEE